MLTRTRSMLGPALAGALIAGLANASEPVREEVVVHGKSVAAVQAESERRRAKLKEHLEALHERQKRELDESLKNHAAASVKLALAATPSRG